MQSKLLPHFFQIKTPSLVTFSPYHHINPLSATINPEKGRDAYPPIF
jgi:hypothetical protein